MNHARRNRLASLYSGADLEHLAYAAGTSLRTVRTWASEPWIVHEKTHTRLVAAAMLGHLPIPQHEISCQLADDLDLVSIVKITADRLASQPYRGLLNSGKIKVL